MKQADFIEFYCETLDRKIPKFFENCRKRKGFFAKLFNIKSDEEKIALEIEAIIDNLTARSSFPRLSSYEINELLPKLVDVNLKFEKLIIKNYESNGAHHYELKQFHEKYSKHTKGLIAVCTTPTKKREFNSSYLKYYTEYQMIGNVIPTNYAILKSESLLVFKNYLIHSKKESIKAMVLAVIKSISREDQGVNQHTKISDVRFLNLLKFLNTLRLVLIDKNENVLLPQLTRVIERSLDILRPEQHRELNNQKKLITKDLLNREIISYENKNKKVHLWNTPKFKFFLKKKEEKRSKEEKSTSFRLLF